MSRRAGNLRRGAQGVKGSATRSIAIQHGYIATRMPGEKFAQCVC